MRILYKPLGIALGLISSRLSIKLFNTIWNRIDGGEVPGPMTRDAKLKRVLLASALQAVAFSGTRAIFQRGGARGWNALFGVWPTKQRR